MDASSRAVGVYLKIQTSGPNKALVVMRYDNVVTFMLPATKLAIEDYCRFVQPISEVIAKALNETSLPRDALLGIFYHINNKLKTQVDTISIFGKASAPHSVNCQDCHWLQDVLDHDLARGDDCRRQARDVTTRLLSRTAFIREDKLIDSLARIEREKPASLPPSIGPLTNTVDEQMHVPSAGAKPEPSGTDQYAPVANMLPHFGFGSIPEATAFSEDDLLRLLDNPNSKVSARLKEMAATMAAEALRHQLKAQDTTSSASPAKEAQDVAMWRKVVSLVNSDSNLENGPPPVGDGRAELSVASDNYIDRLAEEIQDKPNDSGMHARLNGPFAEGDLPSSSTKESIEVDHDTLCDSPIKGRPKPSYDSSDCDDHDNSRVDRDSNTIVVAPQADRVVKRIARVEVTKRPFSQMMDDEFLPIDDDTDVSEESHGARKPPVKRLRGKRSSSAKPPAVARTTSEKMPPVTANNSLSQNVLPDFTRNFEAWRSALPSPAPTPPTSNGRGPQVVAPSTNSVHTLPMREKPKKTTAITANAKSSKPIRPEKTLISPPPRSPASGHARNTTTGFTSKKVIPGDVEEIKISRDADRIINHKYTKKGHIKYELVWKPDNPGWIPTSTWIPGSKFREDSVLITNYRKEPGWAAREKQARADAKIDRTHATFDSLKKPRTR